MPTPTQIGPRPPKGPKPPQMGKFVRHYQRIYRTATKIYPKMSVHSTTYAAQYVPQLGLLSPPESINPQKRGNDWSLLPNSFGVLVKFGTTAKSRRRHLLSHRTCSRARHWIIHVGVPLVHSSRVLIVRNDRLLGSRSKQS